MDGLEERKEIEEENGNIIWVAKPCGRFRCSFCILYMYYRMILYSKKRNGYRKFTCREWWCFGWMDGWMGLGSRCDRSGFSHLLNNCVY